MAVFLRPALLLHRRQRPVQEAEDCLKSDIDEEPGSPCTRPFLGRSPHQHGKIAVKVINDYGDEVMKVFEV